MNKVLGEASTRPLVASETETSEWDEYMGMEGHC